LEHAQRDYLIVPMQPTPNGRLHLGHASGPYLRADVLARHLKRSGHRVRVISGTDVYENWVLLEAQRSGTTPAETCARFHQLISQDLRDLDFDFDNYISPLDPIHADDYRQVHIDILDRLTEKGTAHAVEERFPVARDTGRYIAGVWLLGSCPSCEAPAGGNSCERCGYHFQPSEILNPKSRLDEGPLNWRERTCWFAVPNDPVSLRRTVAACHAPEAIVRTALRYIDQTRGRIRLTIPGEWGMRAARYGDETVLCNTFFAYSVYCGELYARATGALNPFTKGAETITVGVFGIDNAIAGLVGPHSLSQCHEHLRAFDHVVVSYFLNLEGTKFSTSRGHAIWAHEATRRMSATSDEVRYYLSCVCPEEDSSNFGVKDFVDATNRLRRHIEARVAPALRRISTVHQRPIDSVLNRIGSSLDRQASRLSLERPRLAAAVRIVDEWLRDELAESRHEEERYWWLIGLALLSWPFMPRLGGGIWQALGRDGPPRPSGLLAASRPPRPLSLPTPRPLREADVLAHANLAEAT
jgi:methionyl-tRNA synthetase